MKRRNILSMSLLVPNNHDICLRTKEILVEPTYDASLVNSDARRYRQSRINHWDQVARRSDTWRGFGGYYQSELIHYYQILVPSGQRVLDLGCGNGDLLSALRPSFGMGVDFSQEAIKRAKANHPDLLFIVADVHHLSIHGKFDYVIISDLVNDLWDVQMVLDALIQICHPKTKLILNTFSRLWQPVINFTQMTGMSKPNLPQNWLTVEDIINLFTLTGFELIRKTKEILLPIKIPIISNIANRFLVKLWPINHLAVTNFLIFRPFPRTDNTGLQKKPLASVIVPARNEAGNIENIFLRTEKLGFDAEFIFVEGHSTDQTYETIHREIAIHPERKCKLIKQNGKGKGDAVRMGFSNAEGDILIILDADLTVPPEYLLRFYKALITGKAEFVNGVRLVYPMAPDAMRFINLIGNKFFSIAFSWLLGQTIKDTLCGTKALWREDYEQIVRNRSYFGDFDPFGDYDLLFGAAKLNLKIVDLPIRYYDRKYGTTNIQRWRHGWLLLRMVAFAAKRIKFI